jgi:hypothetical protein
MAKIAIQGGVKNYLGNQKTVGNVPLKWQSGPDAPDTELAYITKAEKNLLLKKDLHGSLKNGPNTGPEGIMSLDSQGDKGTYGNTGQSYGDRQTTNTSPEVGDRGGGYQERGDAGYNETIARIRANTAAANAAKEAERQKVLAELSVTPFNRNKPLSKFGLYNNQFQKKQNIKLAQKRAFQKYQDIEQYADLMDDYGLTAEEIADKVAANPSYGYDVSKLEKGLETLTSNKGTSIEKTRPNQYDVNSQLKGRFSLLNPVFDKVRPDTQVTALNTLQKARDYNTLAGNPNITRDMIMDLGNRGKLPEQINPPSGGGGGGGQEYLPYLPEEEVEDEYTNDFTYRFGDGQKIGRDVTLGYLANGGRAGKADGGIMGTRARRAMGGIMNRVDQRQGYFLGGIGKAIKGAVSGVVDATKKVLKSDIGKAALIYAGGTYLGGMKAFGGTGAGFSNFGSRLMSPMGGNSFGSLFSNSLNTKNAGKGIFGRVKGLKDSYDDMGTFGRMATMGGIGLGLSMIPGLNKPKPNEDTYADRGGSLIDPLTGKPAKPAEMRSSLNDALANANGDPARIKRIQDAYAFLPPDERLGTFSPYRTYGVKDGGRIGKAEGGLMDLGGMEKDYRAEGGFVPIGAKEKADDVPARLSVNEFVFTADAVRGAGGGDIDKGAEIMENMMVNLEKGGTVSEESQGNAGAQQMFNTSERLGEVI